MEWITQFFSDGANTSLIGFSSGGVAALILYISNTIRRVIMRTAMTIMLTSGALFAGADWLGFEVTPKSELTASQEERMERLADWQDKVFSLFASNNDEKRG